MNVKPFFHQGTQTISYVVYANDSKDAVIIDPVLDFDLLTAKVTFDALHEIIGFIKASGLTPKLVLDTHLHADHLSGADYLKKRLAIPSAIGKNFLISQEYFAHVYEIKPDPHAYDLLLNDNESQIFGTIKIKTMFTPGHTASCAGFLIDDAFFCGDALFKPELGCGRTDFPLGSAEKLYCSITQKIYALPEQTRIFVGHDYPQEGGHAQPETSVLLSKKNNIMITDQTEKDSFVAKRVKRDAVLLPPRLMLYALQVNICGGKLPEKFFKIPVNLG